MDAPRSASKRHWPVLQQFVVRREPFLDELDLPPPQSPARHDFWTGVNPCQLEGTESQPFAKPPEILVQFGEIQKVVHAKPGMLVSEPQVLRAHLPALLHALAQEIVERHTLGRIGQS